jgi:hypothetical protein
MVWYLLFDGTSVDGSGEGKFVKRTTDKAEAAKHYKKVRKSPYSTGKVMLVNDFDFRLATEKDFK